MPDNTQFVLTAPPSALREATSFGIPVAHIAYRIGPGMQLLRANMPISLRSGLMLIDSSGFNGQGGNIIDLCRQIIRECSVRNFDGIILDFEGNTHALLEQVIGKLASITAPRGWPLYVPEEYAHCSDKTRIIIPSALSGGSLQQRLSDACGQFGAHRVALGVQRIAEDFTLPSSNGRGKPLTREELRRYIHTKNPSVYFSDELCAQYFTYSSHRDGAHFVLFDNAGSIRKKIQIARSLGLIACIFAWPEVEDIIKNIIS